MSAGSARAKRRLPPSAPAITWVQEQLEQRRADTVVEFPEEASARTLAVPKRAAEAEEREALQSYVQATRAYRRLNRAEEVEAGKRIEAAERKVVEALLASPLAHRTIADLERRLREHGPASISEDEIERTLRRLAGLVDRLERAPDRAAAAKVEAEAGMSARELRALDATIRAAEREAAAAKADLVQSHLWEVVWQARRFAGRGVPLLDLIQEGNLALMTAANKFDYRLGPRFSTYALWWIRQAMTRAFRKHARTIRLPEHTSEAIMKLATVRRRLSRELGREPSAAEAGAALGVPAEQVERLMQWAHNVVSLHAPVGEEEDATLGDLLADPDAELPAAAVMANELAAQTRAQMAALTPREREVLSLRFGIDRDEELTLEAIGKRLGMSRERVRQIESRALSKLRHPSRAQVLRHFVE